MKKTKILLIIIFFLCFVVTPFIYGKYASKYDDKIITLNVSKPVYTVTFHSNYGIDATEVQNFTYGTGQLLRANTFTRATYLFVEWNTEPDGTGTSYSNQQSVNRLTSTNNDNIDLYAIWRRELTFTVTGNPTNWTNQDVTLTIVPDYPDTYLYSFDGGTTWQNSPSYTFSSNQTVNMKIKSLDGFISNQVTENITYIDKVAPTISYATSIEYNSDHSTNLVTTLIAYLDDDTSITTGVTANDDLSGVASGYPKCYYNNNEITSTNIFTNVGRYAISCKVQDEAGNETTQNREVLVRWPTGGRYVVKKTSVAGIGHSSSTSPDGLYQDTSDTGLNSSLPFSSKYYYAGANVDNYLSFANKTFRIINVSYNDDIKVIGDISDLSTAWGGVLESSSKSQIYNSNIYNNWSTVWWINGQIYNNESGESKYYTFTNTEKSHIDLATFYAGRVDDNDIIIDIISSEQTNTERLGGASAAFQGYSAYPNVSDFLKACKAHDIFDSLEDIDTGSAYNKRQQFENYSWIDSSAEFWTMNGRTGTLLQNNDFWTIDVDMGLHFESRAYTTSRQYRVVFYITDTTILSGNGTQLNPYNVEEDWAWFDSYQVLQ